MASATICMGCSSISPNIMSSPYDAQRLALSRGAHSQHRAAGSSALLGRVGTQKGMRSVGLGARPTEARRSRPALRARWEHYSGNDHSLTVSSHNAPATFLPSGVMARASARLEVIHVVSR